MQLQSGKFAPSRIQTHKHHAHALVDQILVGNLRPEGALSFLSRVTRSGNPTAHLMHGLWRILFAERRKQRYFAHLPPHAEVLAQQ